MDLVSYWVDYMTWLDYQKRLSRKTGYSQFIHSPESDRSASRIYVIVRGPSLRHFKRFVERIKNFKLVALEDTAQSVFNLNVKSNDIFPNVSIKEKQQDIYATNTSL